MGRKELVIEELVEAIEGKIRVEDVFRRHSDSKSVLYAALDVVLPTARRRVREIAQEIKSAEQRRGTLLKETARLERGLDQLNTEVASQTQKVQQLKAKEKSVGPVVQSAADLAAMGFTKERLKQLYSMLDRLATTEGASSPEVTDAFFELAKHLADVASTEVEAKRLQAQLRGTTRDEKGKRKELAGLKKSLQEARRTLAIVATLHRNGLNRERLARWQELLHRSGITVEELGDKLKQFGSLQDVLNASAQSIEALRSQRQQIEEQIADRERKREMASSDNMRLHGENFRLAVQKDILGRETKDLRDYMELTRLLMEGDDSAWPNVPPNFIKWLLIRAGEWLAVAGLDREIRIPSVIARNRLILPSVGLTPPELVGWLVAGVLPRDSRAGYPGS